MKNVKLYTETQRFNHPLLLSGFFLLGLFMLKGLMNAFYSPDTLPGELTKEIVSFSIFAIVTIFILLMKLCTCIDENGVSIKFFPFHSKYVLYKWDDIELVEVKNYSPLKEFGGWGIRFGKKNSKAFSTRGNVAIHLTFKNGGNRIIGTQKASDLNAFIAQFEMLNKLV